MFITLEGMEGAGKSSLAHGLACRLEKSPPSPVLLTREPGGCGLGKTLRAALLHSEANICPTAELFLFLADRAQHVHEVIRPALEAGRTVICDRFADSTIVYQGYGRGLDPMHLRDLNHEAIGGLWPDLTLIVDLPPEVGLLRARRRNAEQEQTTAEGRFEAEALHFHHLVREGFLHWAALNAPRCVVLSGLLSQEELLEAALKVIHNAD